MTTGIVKAKEYTENSQFQWELALKCLETFPFQKHDHVVDVGCRNGKITDYVAKQVPKGNIIGLDVSENMIAKAQDLHKQSNLAFLCSSPEEIPFSEQFDKLISFYALHWILDQKKALHSMRKCLKHEGMMLLVLPTKSTDLVKKIAHSDNWQNHFPFFQESRVYFTPEEYIELLNDCGIEVLDMQVIQSFAVFKDQDELIKWLTPLVTNISHLSENLQQEFVKELAMEMIQLHRQESKDITISFPMMKIIAKRIY